MTEGAVAGAGGSRRVTLECVVDSAFSVPAARCSTRRSTGSARLSNRLWQFSFDRGSISVSSPYRLADPRVPYKAPGQHTLQPQDAVPGGFYVQQKYPAYSTPIRLASKLEADYIAAEASGDVAQQLALIAARRAANGQSAYAGAADAASVMKELYTCFPLPRTERDNNPGITS